LPSDRQRGAGFDRAVDWGASLVDGYRWRAVRESRPSDSVATHSFWSLASAPVGRAIEATDPDVVVVPGWHSAAYIKALLTCRARGIPILYRGDTHLGNAPGGLRPIVWRTKNRLLLRLFDGDLAVGTRTRPFLTAHVVTE